MKALPESSVCVSLKSLWFWVGSPSQCQRVHPIAQKNLTCSHKQRLKHHTHLHTISFRTTQYILFTFINQPSIYIKIVFKYSFSSSHHIYNIPEYVNLYNITFKCLNEIFYHLSHFSWTISHFKHFRNISKPSINKYNIQFSVNWTILLKNSPNPGELYVWHPHGFTGARIRNRQNQKSSLVISQSRSKNNPI